MKRLEEKKELSSRLRSGGAHRFVVQDPALTDRVCCVCFRERMLLRQLFVGIAQANQLAI